MWPFSKKQEPIVKFECSNWAVRNYAPVRPSREFIPESIQKMHAFADKQRHVIDSVKTVKACAGISEYFNLGYVIPAWCDIELFPNEDGSVNARYSDPQYKHAWHFPEQIGNVLDKKFAVRKPVKLDNPWLIYTKANWSLLWMPMYYWDDRNWEAVPGIMDHDIGALQTPINIMLKEHKYTLIKQGEPLVQVVPIRREKILARTSDITETALQRHRSISSLKFMNFKGWTKFMREKKEYKIDARDLDLPE